MDLGNLFSLFEHFIDYFITITTEHSIPDYRKDVLFYLQI